MKRNDKEIYKQITVRLLFTLVLIFSVSIFSFGQTEESEETPDIIVPEQAMEQVVRTVLAWSFKPRGKPTVVYLAEQRIKQSWLPTIKNIEFRLLPVEKILVYRHIVIIGKKKQRISEHKFS